MKYEYLTPTNINQIKANSKINDNHFFDKGAMRFFNSRITNKIKRIAGSKDIYFITSEQFDYNSPRLYTIRKYTHSNCAIDTIGKFQGHNTLYKAKKTMEML